ncbi:MAG: hypothetical protein ABEJ56_03005 [Candidatus Nanohaloarchaea archaeon]
MKTLDGYEVPEEVVEEIRYRIREMPKEEIDEFYHDVGFIVEDAKDDGNKALTDKQLDWIKEGDNAMIDNLIRDENREVLEEVVNKLTQEGEKEFNQG